MKILAVYVNKNYADCYTVYFDYVEKIVGGAVFYQALSMSENPTSPQGVCQHTYGQLGRHNGIKIPFSALPVMHQKIVNDELNAVNNKGGDNVISSD